MTEPKVERVDGRVVIGPGLYEQVQTMVAGMQGTGNGHAARSMPPIWIEAVDIVNDIDTALMAWQVGLPELPRPRPRFVSGAAQRIRELGKRSWRPQDTKTLEKITAALVGWAKPPRKLHIAAACPACGATTVKRTDSGGERVNLPALQMTPSRVARARNAGTHRRRISTCTCAVCSASRSRPACSSDVQDGLVDVDVDQAGTGARDAQPRARGGDAMRLRRVTRRASGPRNPHHPRHPHPGAAGRGSLARCPQSTSMDAATHARIP
jgi:hypothetical protein